MNLEHHWLLQKERTLAWVRLGFSMAAIVVIQLNPARVANFPILSHISLVSFSIYSLLVLYYLTKKEGLNFQRLALATSVLDLLWISVIVLSTGGSRTPFFVYYLFPVITGSSRYGIRGGIVVALIGVGLYGLIRLTPISPNPIAIDTFLIRSAYLLVFAYIFGFLSEFEKSQNRKLMALYTTAGEAATLEERRRIARELHDRLLQVLASLALRLEAYGKRFAGSDSELVRELHDMEEVARDSIRAIRQFLSGKATPSLAPGTLLDRIKEELRFLRDGLGLMVLLDIKPEEDLSIPPEAEQELYYVLREGLLNIARHSQASKITLSFKQTDKEIQVSLEDD